MEQTSSTSYPNALVADYMTRARVARPEVMMRAQELVNIGYQRIVTFQTAGGGFGWWQGANEPVVWVTAYGMNQLLDASHVVEIDSRVIERAREWLYTQQNAEGAWSNVGQTHGEIVASIQDPRLALTSYVATALIAGGDRSDNVRRGIDFIRGHLDLAQGSVYVLALAAQALASWDPQDAATRSLLERIRGMKHDDGETSYWGGEGQTLSFARGDAATIETTALVALSFMKGRFAPGDTQRAIRYLVARRNGGGGWGSTQATILALKALIEGLGAGSIDRPIAAIVRINGHEEVVDITPDQADVLHVRDLTPYLHAGTNQIEVETEGESTLLYQLAGRYYVPWDGAEEPASTIEVGVEYDRTRLTTDEILTATARMRYNGEMPTYMMIVDLGIPPGFTVDRTAFQEMVANHQIERFETTARQITLYLGGIQPGDEKTFTYQLVPRYPLRARAPGADAYEYYTPQNRAESGSQEIEVTEPD